MLDSKLESILESYSLFRRAKGHTPASLDISLRSIRAFCSFLGCDEPRRATADDLRRYFVFLREKRVWSEKPWAKERLLSATTINTYGRSIRAFWNWMASQKLIGENPMAGVAVPKASKTMAKVYSEAELRAVLAKAAEEPLHYGIVLLFLDSGIRLA